MKLNIKNKFYIFIFAILVVGMVVILVLSASEARKKRSSTFKYEVSTNAVLFKDDSDRIDTSLGGVIDKKWDDNYYYTDNKDHSYLLGSCSVVFEKASEIVKILGTSYKIAKNGSVDAYKDSIDVNNIRDSSIYKLKDREYLIISPQIYSEDKNIYASKYLIVYLDKQGNASLLNDSVNVKTINPMILNFDEYKFDIANEKLVIEEQIIDLKAVIGSTNEYEPPKVEDTKDKKATKEEFERLKEAYNKLVNDFNQYANNANLALASNTKSIVNNNYIIKKVAESSSGIAGKINKAINKSIINKRVSLRGTVSRSTYIDVTYVVTDPEERYQGVYLLVNGIINGTFTTEKILLDKYATGYRITNLSTNSEYSISLGYIEVVDDGSGNKELVDNIEDVVNVRTTKPNATLTVTRVSSGRAYFNLKMYNDFTFEGGRLVMYANNASVDSVQVNANQALTDKGWSGSLSLGGASDVYTIKLEDIRYAGIPIASGVYKNFTFDTAS